MPDDKPATDILGLFERVSVALAGRVDGLEVQCAKHGERLDAYGERLGKLESRLDDKGTGAKLIGKLSENPASFVGACALLCFVLLLAASWIGIPIPSISSPVITTGAHATETTP